MLSLRLASLSIDTTIPSRELCQKYVPIRIAASGLLQQSSTAQATHITTPGSQRARHVMSRQGKSHTLQPDCLCNMFTDVVCTTFVYIACTLVSPFRWDRSQGTSRCMSTPPRMRLLSTASASIAVTTMTARVRDTDLLSTGVRDGIVSRTGDA